jgi:hypothetical protein
MAEQLSLPLWESVNPYAPGTRYGRLTVLGEAGRRRNSIRYIQARCDCGTEKAVYYYMLLKGRTRSYGCFGRERATVMFKSPEFIARYGGHNRTHGMSRSQHPLYRAWKAMRTRCTNQNLPQFKDWGGRGIGICERWEMFENFWTDMEPTWRPGLTLDRTNNDADYSPENYRWTTRKVQNRNRRLRRIVDTPQWGPIPMWLAAERSGIRYSLLHERLRKGQPLFPLKPRGRGVVSEKVHAPRVDLEHGDRFMASRFHDL